MTVPDPLSPEALLVPEVHNALVEFSCTIGAHEYDAAATALLLAVRDTVLAAERARLVGLTPEQVVEAAVAADLGSAYCDLCVESWRGPDGDRKSEACDECAKLRVRAALPVLLAPEVAKREQAEAELEETAQVLVNTRHLAAESMRAEVARLRGALEEAYREGWNECIRSGPTDQSRGDSVEKSWESSDARAALKEAP